MTDLALQRRADHKLVEGVAWLADLRTEAEARLQAEGLPTVHHEDWHYTNLGIVAKKTLSPAAAVAGTALPATAFAGPLLSLVNGRLDRAGSDLDGLPAGIRLQTLADLTAADEARLRPLFLSDAGAATEALNMAELQDAVILTVERNAAIAAPVLVRHVLVADGEQVAHPRLLVLVEDGAALTLVEQFGGVAGSAAPAKALSWINPVRTFSVGANAALQLVTLIEEDAAAIHTGAAAVTLARDARLHGWTLLSGGQIARQEFRVTFAGKGAEAEIRGATLGRGAQSLSIFTVFDHAVPHTESRQIFRSVMDKGGKSAYQGRVIVREDAQKTDASQSSRNLLLDRSAEAATKPELEIYADDVKCAHGATVGQLDADMLFYLEARGIAPDVARGMLVEAFVASVIEDVPVPDVAAYIAHVVETWMHARNSEETRR